MAITCDSDKQWDVPGDGKGSTDHVDQVQGSVSNGWRVILDPQDVEQTNFRAVGMVETSRKQTFIIQKELPLDLLFFRFIFTKLRERVKRTDLDYDECIPIEDFQRTLERLFYVLRDPQGFDAKVYDENGNGFVGWGEFCYVFKKRKINVQLTITERIFLTLDNPDSSYLSNIVSNIVLLVILLSSVCYVLSTYDQFQVAPEDDRDGEPLQHETFQVIEQFCLLLFVVEYLARLFTCWGVRAEVFNEAKLLEITTGFEFVHLDSPPIRVLRFLTAPSNIVDLAAILPGVLGMLELTGSSGGGVFVVLRLLRLTRVFRIFQTIRGPAIIIMRTLEKSTQALCVFTFNFVLSIVIGGSVMWFLEGGSWNRDTHTYDRRVARAWNGAGWEDVMAESPFLSIPDTFWWAIVTATTVGYGDQYPTTRMGKIWTALYMIVCLVMLALPVGVVGGNFSQEWLNFDKEKKELHARKKCERAFITSAIQRIDPSSMSSLMFIEVWNERFPSKIEAWGCSPAEGLQSRPSSAEFMGSARIELELPDTPVKKELKLHLKEDLDTVLRKIRGSIKVAYEWKPTKQIGWDRTCAHPGTLNFTLVGCEGLVPLNCVDGKPLSNPYCLLYCYPSSPSPAGELIRPTIWRSPTIVNTLAPQWQVSHTFDFNWQPTAMRLRDSSTSHSGALRNEEDESSPSSPKIPATPKTPAIHPGNSPRKDRITRQDTHDQQLGAQVGEVLSTLKGLASQVTQVQQDLHALTDRVDKLSLETRPPLEAPRSASS